MMIEIVVACVTVIVVTDLDHGSDCDGVYGVTVVDVTGVCGCGCDEVVCVWWKRKWVRESEGEERK